MTNQNVRAAAGMMVNMMTLKAIESAKKTFLENTSLSTTFQEGETEFTLSATEMVEAFDRAIKRLT